MSNRYTIQVKLQRAAANAQWQYLGVTGGWVKNIEEARTMTRKEAKANVESMGKRNPLVRFRVGPEAPEGPS